MNLSDQLFKELKNETFQTKLVSTIINPFLKHLINKIFPYIVIFLLVQILLIIILIFYIIIIYKSLFVS